MNLQRVPTFYPPEDIPKFQAALQQHLESFASLDLPSAPNYTTFHVDGSPDLPLFVPYKPAVEEAAAWLDSGYTPVWRRGAHRHPHALLGAGRCLAEHAISALIKQRSDELARPVFVYDVGSNADRFRTSLALFAPEAVTDVHHNVPVLQPGDAQRAINARAKYPRHCSCRFQDCEHRGMCDVYVYQHSLYYFTPMEILHTLPIGAIALASVHHIFDACGNILNGQMVYHVNDDGMVDALARGNSHHYVHADVAWLKLGEFSDGQTTLTWELVSSHLESHVYRFDRVDVAKAPPPPPAGFHSGGYGDLTEEFSAVVNRSIVSVMDTRKIGPNTDPRGFAQALPVRRITLRCGLALAYEDGGRVLAFPAGLVGHLAARATNLPRTPLLATTLADLGRRYLLAGAFPSERIPPILTVAVAAALVQNVEHETATLGRMNHLYGPIFREHTKALAGGAIDKWRWYNWFSPKFWWATCTCSEDEHHTDEAITFDLLRRGGLTPPSGPPLRLPPATRFPPRYEPKTSDDVEQRSDNAISRGGNDPLREPPEPTVRQVLPAFFGAVPTTARNNADAVVSALRKRLGRAVPLEDQDAWRGVNDRLSDPKSVLHRLMLDHPIELNEGIWQSWLAKFPQRERDKFTAARNELRQRPLNLRDLNGSAMIKIEKSGLITPAGLPKLDERVVIAYKPIRQVATGPYDWILAKTFRKRFAPEIGNAVVWVNGENAEASRFGLWYDSAIGSINSQVHRFKGDHMKFEVHRQQRCFATNLRVYCTAVTDSKYRFARRNITVRGRAQRFDIHYQFEYILGSGGTETSIDSFIRNLEGLVHTFGEPAWGTTMFFLNGDDWGVVTSVHLPVEEIITRMLQLGFETDAEYCVNDTTMDFCQCVPYPVDGRTVWGPKIGRVLTRIPWATASQHDDPVGVALGMRPAVSHIPFLREYFNMIAAAHPSTMPIRYDHHIASCEILAPGRDTYAFIMEKYGLTDQDLTTFIALLASINGVVGVYPWPRLEALMEVDAS